MALTVLVELGRDAELKGENLILAAIAELHHLGELLLIESGRGQLSEGGGRLHREVDACTFLRDVLGGLREDGLERLCDGGVSSAAECHHQRGLLGQQREIFQDLAQAHALGVFWQIEERVGRQR